jgi:hypothetical protein
MENYEIFFISNNMMTIFGNPRSGSPDSIVSESNPDPDLNEKHTESQEIKK